jgi:FkbM family methyltransferase
MQIFRIVEFHIAYYVSRYVNYFRIRNCKIHFFAGSRDSIRLIFREIFLERCYQFTESTRVELAKNPRVQFLDVGANIGLATLLILRDFPELNVVCFEASPLNYALLERNILENKYQSVLLHNTFIGDDNSKVLFRHSHKKPGSSRRVESNSQESLKPYISEFEVKSQTLSSFLRKDITYVLKIDIEGGEYAVLQELLSSDSTNLILEIIAEVTIGSVESLKVLTDIIEEYEKVGFKNRIMSDYSAKDLLKRRSQGHLILSLFR